MSWPKSITLKASTRLRGFPLRGEVRSFTVSVDEPQLLGGTDKAPNPLEYLLLSQASCLSIVIGMVAQKKNVKLSEVLVEATSNFDLESFLKSQSVGLKEVELKVALRADAELSTLRTLVEEAEKICPVKNTLAAKIKIQVEKLSQAVENPEPR